MSVLTLSPPCDFVGWDAFRPYLLFLATVHIQKSSVGKPLMAKLDPEDLVQETLLKAWECQDQCRGVAMGEKLAWLRQILANTIANHFRAFLTEKRNLFREVAIDPKENSTPFPHRFSVDNQPTPGAQVSHNEQLHRVSSAMMNLSPSQRCVILARHVEGLSFAQIGVRLGKTRDAVTKDWARGILRLRELMGGFA